MQKQGYLWKLFKGICGIYKFLVIPFRTPNKSQNKRTHPHTHTWKYFYGEITGGNPLNKTLTL